MYIDQEDILNHISAKPFHLISEAADELGVEAYVIGGYVRDIFLYRPSKDIDVVAVGSGIELAKAVASKLGKRTHLSVFKNFGTAQVKSGDLEIEFVGARKELTAMTAGNRSWKTVRWKTIRTVVILRSMRWLLSE